MNFDARDQYGFPIGIRLLKAQEYAAAARERNKRPCSCDSCKEKEMLTAVIQITKNWEGK